MIKVLTNIFFKEILPWKVYGDTEDELMSHLLMDGSQYVCEQVESFFERNGYSSPYDEDDFIVEGGQVEKFMFLRVMLNNHKYTDVYGFYVLFDLNFAICFLITSAKSDQQMDTPTTPAAMPIAIFMVSRK